MDAITITLTALLAAAIIAGVWGITAARAQVHALADKLDREQVSVELAWSDAATAKAEAEKLRWRLRRENRPAQAGPVVETIRATMRGTSVEGGEVLMHLASEHVSLGSDAGAMLGRDVVVMTRDRYHTLKKETWG